MYTTAVHQDDGKKVLKDDRRVVMLEGHSRCRSAEMIRDEDRLVWAAKLLLVQYTFCIDKKLINPAQAIKISKIEITSAAMVHRETSFTDTIQSVLNFARAFKEGYVMGFGNLHVLDIVDYMM